MKAYKITWEHVEGDGIFTLMQGMPSGTRGETVWAESEKDAVAAFEACHRHGSRLVSVREVAR
ncbi:MAG: hypothetical protein FWH21_00195 [Kiritimatiellaeota bacterium]|nr:hypothetical protein [Kiritimatiellota bacterium]